MKCRWIVRPGTNNTFWAYTTCKRGFNYLSKVSKLEQIKPHYDGHLCPICSKTIECDTTLLDEQEEVI